MDAPGRKRSRGGCERCRRRRQKCDEVQPACARCRDAGVGCQYKVNVRWGGRDFMRSSFGDCEVQKIELEPGHFVYTAKDKEKTGVQARKSQTILRVQQTVVPRIALPELPGCDKDVRSLVHYFVHHGSASISTHSQIQEETCRTLLPAAVGAPALLYAIAGYAAAHMASHMASHTTASALFAPGRQRLKVQELQARTRSIESLRQCMETGAAFSPVIVMGTSLMLCLGALLCGDDDYNLWRLYLGGAKAAFPAACALRRRSKNHGQPPTYDEQLTDYLKKRYLLLEAVAMLSTKGFEALDWADVEGEEQEQEQQSSETTRAARPIRGRRAVAWPVVARRPREQQGGGGACDQTMPDIFLDDHVACYTDLFHLLRVIGAVAGERRQLRLHGNRRRPNTLLTDVDFAAEADDLEAQVFAMMREHGSAPPVMLPHVTAVLQPQQIDEFVVCNQVYEHYALLQIRTEIRCLPPSDARVQTLVQQILELAARVQPRPGLSPALSLNTALFSAGQHALGEQREVVRQLLEHFYAETHNNNLRMSMRSLETHWRGAASAVPPGGGVMEMTDSDFIAY